MPPVLLSTASHRRDVGAFPEAVLINMLAEPAPSDVEKGVDLIARPGLQAFTAAGVGAIRGIVRRSGVFGGDALVVSGTEVYRVSAAGAATLLTGSVPGYNLVSMDATSIAGVSTARIATGSGIYVVNGTTVAAESFPDSAGVDAVAVLKGFWFAVRGDTQQIYSREPGASSWTALAFTSAEGEPDLLEGLAVLGDYLIPLGEETIEFHSLTGSTSPAIEPVPGMRFDRGCRNRNTAVICDNALVFVGDDAAVYEMRGAAPTRISDNGIEERIREAVTADLRAWSFSIDGHSLYVLTLGDQGTWARDAATGRWSRFKSRDYAHWRAHLGCSMGSRIVAADSESGALWIVDPDRLDDAGTEIERHCTGLIDVREGRRNIGSVQALCAVGLGKDGGSEAAQVSLRTSKDNGRTFSDWRTISLGALGNYRREVIWRRLGHGVPPGVIVQVRCSDTTTHRMSDLRFNV